MNTNARSTRGRGPGDVRGLLRTRTAAIHARLDALFADGLATPGRYAGYIAGMHRFATDYEIVIGALPRQSFWLAGDLQHLGLTPLPPSGVCTPVADTAERLGWEYVMAGSSVGARYLVRQALALGHGETAGACFLARHAGGEDWPRMLARLEAVSAADDALLSRLERGAREAFILAHRCLERGLAAYPDALQKEAAA